MMKKEIYSFRTEENEFERAYENIKNLIGRFADFEGDLKAFKKLVDKYTIKEFLLSHGFKNTEKHNVFNLQNENGELTVELNDFGNEVVSMKNGENTQLPIILIMLELGEYVNVEEKH